MPVDRELPSEAEDPPRHGRSTRLPRVVLWEDDDLLVVNKPPGISTHSPAHFAGDGIYDWLRHRERRWAQLAILHRLDKETSGVLVFGKTSRANRSLTAQFTNRSVQKCYALLSEGKPPTSPFTVTSGIVRAGERYVSRPPGPEAPLAETRFQVLEETSGRTFIRAEPRTGRTHQIRVQATEGGFPILGDTLYGGSPWGRLCLHSESLSLRHPVTDEIVTFRAPFDFNTESRWALRQEMFDPEETNAYRLVHGASDGEPGWHVDHLGDYLLSHSTESLEDRRRRILAGLAAGRGCYHRLLDRQVRRADPTDAGPCRLEGKEAPGRFVVRENGLQFELSFREGYSFGLFLDQRENRRRFLVNHVAAEFELLPDGDTAGDLLNTFAYTCGFSVCAAAGGWRTTSLDLSRKYLDWGKRNFLLNGLSLDGHEFIYGDVFDWARRLGRKGRQFDAIVLDPPTFSHSKSGGWFRAASDYGRLAASVLPLLRRPGVVLASSNANSLEPAAFLEMVRDAVHREGRQITAEYYAAQPTDFPITRQEPAHLKTVWLRIE